MDWVLDQSEIGEEIIELGYCGNDFALAVKCS